MTKADELNALADRCEREEASCMLDALIERAINPERRAVREAVYGLLRDFPLEKWDDWHAIAQHVGAEDYTTSLDAAVGLVPEGWNWSVEHYCFDAVIPYREPGQKASVWRDSRNPTERIFNIEAKTPALALCAAALRARAALSQTDGQEATGSPSAPHPSREQGGFEQ